MESKTFYNIESLSQDYRVHKYQKLTMVETKIHVDGNLRSVFGIKELTTKECDKLESILRGCEALGYLILRGNFDWLAKLIEEREIWKTWSMLSFYEIHDPTPLPKHQFFKTLSLVGYAPTSLVQEWSKISYKTGLESLGIRYCHVENEQVQRIAADAPQLKALELFRTKIKELTIPKSWANLHSLFLPKKWSTYLYKKYPDLVKKIPYVMGGSREEMDKYEQVLAIVRLYGYDWIYRAVVFNLLANNFEKVKRFAELEHIYQAMDFPKVDIVQQRAIEYFEYQLAKTKLTFSDKSYVLVLGKIGMNKNDLKNRLKELNIKTTTRRYLKKVTHILVGASPSGISAIMQEYPNIQLFTEQMALNFFQEQQGAFLLEGTKEEQVAQVAKIKNLLLSQNEEDILVALSLVDRGGLPTECLAAVFAALLYVQNRQAQIGLERVFKQYASAELQHIAKPQLKKNALLQFIYTSETSVTTVLRRFDKVEGFDTMVVAEQVYRKTKNGLNYIVRYSEGEEGKQRVAKYINNGCLNLSILGLRALPKIVYELEDIEELNLSMNPIKTITKKINRLTKLKVLHINNTKIDKEKLKNTLDREIIIYG